MKLLFDHNLSPQLVNRFTDLYPDSQHVFLLGMDQDDDRRIWEYAAQHDFTIVTRDSDYNDLSLLLGFPPRSSGFDEAIAPPKRSKLSSAPQPQPFRNSTKLHRSVS
jgi:hypothetical protein